MTIHSTFVALYYQAKWLVNYTCNHKNSICTHFAFIHACLPAIVQITKYMTLFMRLMSTTTEATYQYNRQSKVAEHSYLMIEYTHNNIVTLQQNVVLALMHGNPKCCDFSFREATNFPTASQHRKRPATGCVLSHGLLGITGT